MKTATTLLLAGLALAGCATPQPALDQANHTVAMMAQLEIELKEFARVQDVAAQARLRSIARQERDIEAVASQTRVAVAVRTANGDMSAANLQAKLATVAGAVGQSDETRKAAVAAVDAELAALLKPLPSTAEKSSAAQKALAEMGSELPRGTRFSELKAFYTVVKESVDTNRKKIKDAEEAAKTAAKE